MTNAADGVALLVMLLGAIALAAPRRRSITHWMFAGRDSGRAGDRRQGATR